MVYHIIVLDLRHFT